MGELWKKERNSISPLESARTPRPPQANLLRSALLDQRRTERQVPLLPSLPDRELKFLPQIDCSRQLYLHIASRIALDDQSLGSSNGQSPSNGCRGIRKRNVTTGA